jgi:hypothetical protein
MEAQFGYSELFEGMPGAVATASSFLKSAKPRRGRSRATL